MITRIDHTQIIMMLEAVRDAERYRRDLADLPVSEAACDANAAIGQQYRELAKCLSVTLKAIFDEGGLVVITRDGEAIAVVDSADDYEELTQISLRDELRKMT